MSQPFSRMRRCCVFKLVWMKEIRQTHTQAECSYKIGHHCRETDSINRNIIYQGELSLLLDKWRDVTVKRALLVIDVQYEYFTGKMPVTYPTGSFDKILKAVDAANQNNVPVILIRHESPQKDATAFVKGSHGWEIHEDLLTKEHSRIIDKQLPGSFTGTELEEYLRSMGIETVVICGYMTQMCCDTTARQALHRGFSVEFLSDATGTLDIANYVGTISAADLHKAILMTQAMRFSRVMSTEDWSREIQG